MTWRGDRYEGSSKCTRKGDAQDLLDRVPRAPERPLRSLDEESQRAVPTVDDPYGFAVRIMMDSGARWSELCRLTREDLVDGELVIHGMTKNRRMRRVPVPPALAVEIRGHVGRLVPFEAKDVSWFNVAVRARSGVAAFSAHACRHSFGFNYAARGGNILALKELMGHSTVELTAHYAKPGHEAACRRRPRPRRSRPMITMYFRMPPWQTPTLPNCWFHPCLR